jgi:HlyD family secretion protein
MSSVTENPAPQPNSRLGTVLARQVLSTPDRLDRLFVVIGWRGWVAVLALTALLTTAILWGCLARVPETVAGAGILIGPEGVRPVQAPYDSQVLEVKVRPGEEVKQGDVLARVNLPDLELQHIQATRRLTELREDDYHQTHLEDMRLKQEGELRESKREVLKRTIDEGKKVLARLKEDATRVLANQRQQAEKSRAEAVKLREGLAEKLASTQRMVDQRLLPLERLVDAESRHLDSGLSLNNVVMRLAEIGLKEVENFQSVAQQQSRVADLQLQLIQLDAQETQLKQEVARERARRLVLKQEQEDRVRQTEGLLEKYRVIRSPYDGRVAEVVLQPGQVLKTGERVGAVARTNDTTTLTHRAYFPVAGGKRVRPGMAVRVTPTTVQRERYGGMVGTVRWVSPFPLTRDKAAAELGNAELVKGLLPPSGVIEALVDLEPANTPSGYRWTSSGPPHPVTVGMTTVTRVTVEERAPITYLLPLLRKLWEGGDTGELPTHPEEPQLPKQPGTP